MSVETSERRRTPGIQRRSRQVTYLSERFDSVTVSRPEDTRRLGAEKGSTMCKAACGSTSDAGSIPVSSTGIRSLKTRSIFHGG